MKKKLLSLALALAMCLSLTVPAFAAEAKWKVEIVGKPDAYVGEGTFTLRDWSFSASPATDEEKDEYWVDEVSVATKTDSRTYIVENLYVMSKDDIAVFTKGGESFDNLFRATAWSDPDGDGVYDQLIFDMDGTGEFLPADTVGPVRRPFDGMLQNYGFIYNFNIKNVVGDSPLSEYGDWDAVGYGGTFPSTDLKLKADLLIDLYGPNTLVVVEADNDWHCAILVEGDASQPTTPSFSDVKSSDYFAEPVAWAVEKNITVGTSSSTFSPNATCTQGQILTFLWRSQGEPKPSGTVSGTQYYAAAAQWANEQGLTDSFSAEADCTRAMVVTYLWKLAGSPKTGTSNFSDVPANADYAQAVAWAVEQGITSGTSATTFSPTATCTRGQIVTFLYRAFAE